MSFIKFSSETFFILSIHNYYLSESGTTAKCFICHKLIVSLVIQVFLCFYKYGNDLL